MDSLGKKLEALQDAHRRMYALNTGLPQSLTDNRIRYTAVVMAIFNAAVGVWSVVNVPSISEYELACALVTASLALPTALIQLRGVTIPKSLRILIHVQEMHRQLDPSKNLVDLSVTEVDVTLNWPEAALISSAESKIPIIRVFVGVNHAAIIGEVK